MSLYNLYISLSESLSVRLGNSPEALHLPPLGRAFGSCLWLRVPFRAVDPCASHFFVIQDLVLVFLGFHMDGWHCLCILRLSSRRDGVKSVGWHGETWRIRGA